MEIYYDKGLVLWGLKCGEKRITKPLFLEVFNIKGQWAAVRYEDGDTGIVDSKGECVKRFPKLERIEFVENDFVRLSDQGKEMLMDMRSMLLYSYMPESRFYGEFELLFIGEWIYTRTKLRYGVAEKRDCPPCLHADGLYLTMPCDKASMTDHLENHDEEDNTWLEQLGKWVSSVSGRACLIAGDDSQAYWVYRWLSDLTIVVIDNDLCFYHVTEVRDMDGRMKAQKRFVAQADEKTNKEEIDRLLQPIAEEAEMKSYERYRLRKAVEERKRELRLQELTGTEPFKMGNKWGLKQEERIVVPPLYRSVRTPVGRYCAVEKNYHQWGIMAVDGKIVVEPKYEDVEIFEDGMAELTVYGEKKIRMEIKG